MHIRLISILTVSDEIMKNGMLELKNEGVVIVSTNQCE